MKKIYCISGMGCDHRVFRRLHVEGYEFVPLAWVPYEDTQTLPDYAAKLAMQIAREPEVTLLGLSFGGMLATEISKIRPVKQVILVSSAKTGKELPEPGRLARHMVHNRWIPPLFFAVPNRLSLTLKGVITVGDKSDVATDGRFMQWALKVIMDWRNTTYPTTYAHIHGTLDVVIPYKNVAATHMVKNGGHLMVFMKAGEVSKVIKGILNRDQ